MPPKDNNCIKHNGQNFYGLSAPIKFSEVLGKTHTNFDRDAWNKLFSEFDLYNLTVDELVHTMNDFFSKSDDTPNPEDYF